MKRRLTLIFVLILVLLTAGCSAGGRTPETVPTEPPVADVGGTQVDLNATDLDLSAGAFEVEKLVEAASELPKVRSIDLGTAALTVEEFLNLQGAYPNAQIACNLEIFGQAVAQDAQFLDASAMTAEQTDELIAALPLLSQLQQINFIAEDGTGVYSVEQISQLDKVREALPEAYLRVSFELFGQTVTSDDERIEYYLTEIGNEGVETVRTVLPYLKSCTYFLMDGCGIDYEVLAQLRDDFPETKIVWRVWLVEEDYESAMFLRCGSFLTDTHRVRTTYVNDRNHHVLNYCTETKYLDVGHIENLHHCDFLAYMPDLEVCIIAITGITDITPLANHEKLEYLELFTTDISDLTPLISCPNIEHLNITNMPKLKDITPVYTLKKLKRLRMVDNPLITYAQKLEVAQMLPDCEMLNHGHFATAWFWRKDENGEYVERYALLREQLEYEIDFTYGIP